MSVYKNRSGGAIIVDIDGTVAERGDRDIFDMSRVGCDIPIIPVINIVKAFKALNYTIIFITGREDRDNCAAETCKWFEKNNIPYDILHMRGKGDYRKDYIVKEEIYRDQIENKFDVEFVLDDRNGPVNMWRDIGLLCLQVQPEKE